MDAIPLPALSLTADCIEDPFPIHYLTLARVSKQFNRIFTSDRLWAKFNVYNVKKNIYKHYLKHEPKMSKYEWLFDFAEVDSQIDNFYEVYKGLCRYSQMSILRMRYREKRWLHGQVSCRELIKCAIQLDGRAIQYASAALRDDRELVELAVKQNGRCLTELPTKYSKERRTVLHAVRSNGMVLDSLGARFKADREIVEAAVTSWPKAICVASEKLQKDPTVLKLAFRSNLSCDILSFVPIERVSKDLAIDALTHHIPAMEQLRFKFGDDRDVIFAAVQNDGMLLSCASLRLRADPELVLAAIDHTGAAITLAALELRENREFVYKAVKANGAAYDFLPLALRGERELAVLATSYGRAIEAMPSKLKNDREIATLSIRSDPMSLRFLSRELRDSTELVQLAVSLKPSALRWASQRIRADPEIALPALARDGTLLEVLPQFENCRPMLAHALNAGADARSIVGCQQVDELNVLARWNGSYKYGNIGGYEWWGMHSEEKLATVFQRNSRRY